MTTGFALQNFLKDGKTPAPGPTYLADYDYEKDRFTFAVTRKIARLTGTEAVPPMYFTNQRSAKTYVNKLPEQYRTRWIPTEETIPEGLY